MKRPEGKAAHTPAQALQRAGEEAEVLDLVAQGYNFRQIAHHLDCSPSTAYKRYIDGRNALPREMAEHVMSEVRETARAIRKAHWALRDQPEHAKIILMADKNILATMPTKTELTGKDGGPITYASAAEMTDAQLERVARGQPPGPPGESDPGDPAPSEAED